MTITADPPAAAGAERTLAVAEGGPATGFRIALAEVFMYFDDHAGDAPDIGHEPMINIRVKSGTERERIAAVAKVAAWLGVPLTHENGTFMALRRFGPPGECVIVEAHYTPDHDLAHAMRLKAAAELEGTEVA
jgi:hypothetical protein